MTVMETTTTTTTTIDNNNSNNDDNSSPHDGTPRPNKRQRQCHKDYTGSACCSTDWVDTKLKEDKEQQEPALDYTQQYEQQKKDQETLERTKKDEQADCDYDEWNSAPSLDSDTLCSFSNDEDDSSNDGCLFRMGTTVMDTTVTTLTRPALMECLHDDLIVQCLFGGYLNTLDVVRTVSRLSKRIQQLAHRHVRLLDLRGLLKLRPENVRCIVKRYPNVMVSD